MSGRRWYTADALTADLTNHHHHLRAASKVEAERRTRRRYPGAVAVLVRLEESWRQGPSVPPASVLLATYVNARAGNSEGGGASDTSSQSGIAQE